ncbi:MAG TPA: esterase-like activity of phytase family protein [Pseudonocardia sp.]
MTLDGYSDALDRTTFGGVYVGNLSGLAREVDGRILALSDRSALFTLDPASRRPTGVVRLADELGRPLDSEAVVVDGNGDRLVTSETEPSVRRYAPDGTLRGRLPVPAPLLVAPAGRGRVNLSFEGLALLPGGHTLLASMEAPLAGDSGGLVRFQTWTRTGDRGQFRPGDQYGYPADPGLGVAEVASVGDGRLLVLERGYITGIGNTVRLYLADPRPAGDVGSAQQLTDPTDRRLIRKTLLADLGACPTLGATARAPQPNPLLDNVEGMAVLGGDPASGLRVLLVSDDNQRTDQVTRLYDLAVRPPAG